MERNGLMMDQRLKWIKVRIKVRIICVYFHYGYNQSINRTMKTGKERIRITVTLI